jgi:hypothetical protein
MDDEAVEIMKYLVGRGSSRTTLVRAAASAARAVIPLTGKRKAEAIAALQTVERWIADPSRANTQLAENQVFSIGFCYIGTQTMPETFAILAAKNVVLACFHNSDQLHPAVFAVECAAKAAAGHDIDMAVLVTAELL